MNVLDISKVSIQNRPVVIGVPRSFYVEYYGKVISTGRLFIVVRPRENWEYTDFAVLLDVSTDGNGDHFTSLGVTQTTRYRDGGTTDIETKQGNWHFPSPFNRNDKATFDGEELEVYDPERTRELLI
jgi:hypothetical protein